MNAPLTGPIVPPLLGEYDPRLFTAADLAAMPTDLPSGPVRYELHHGRLILMTPPGELHGTVDSNLITELKIQGERAGHGKAKSETGVVLARNPDHVLGPDALFIANDRLPLQRSPEGYLLTIPHLVVEVPSKNDTLAALGRKAQDYLDAGVVVVWVVDPFNRNALEHRQGRPVVTIDETGTLTVPDVIPGFSLTVSAALQE